jgi:DNA-binding transcriptional ArsR family regulator
MHRGIFGPRGRVLRWLAVGALLCAAPLASASSNAPPAGEGMPALPGGPGLVPSTAFLGEGETTHGVVPATDPSHLDSDADGIVDGADNCPGVFNTKQADRDGNGIGDACERNAPATAAPEPAIAAPVAPVLDHDLDGIADAQDNCPAVPNANQRDLDADNVGDSCDPDVDGDGILNLADNCQFVPNPGQEDRNGDGMGDACGANDVGGIGRARGNVPLGPQSTMPLVASTVSPVFLFAVGSAIAASGLFVALRRRGLPFLFGIGLFTRLRTSDLLEHPVRAQIMQAIESLPGLHAQELARRINRPRSVVEHHLRTLERGGLISAQHSGTRIRYVSKSTPRGVLPPAGPSAQRIFQLVQNRPGLTLRELADQARMSYRAVHYQVRRLEGEGLVFVSPGETMRILPRPALFAVPVAALPAA